MTFFPNVQFDAEKWEDNRGWLQVLHESRDVVLKRSFSKAGVFRGLHLQVDPFLQTKLIRVTKGKIIDFVASPSDPSKTIHHQELGPDNGWVRIESHLAHGFFALEDTLFEYMCDGGYNEASERAYSIIDYLKNQLGFTNMVLSDKDRASPPLWDSASNKI